MLEAGNKSIARRGFLAAGATAGTIAILSNGRDVHADTRSASTVMPKSNRTVLTSCKLSMVAKEANGKPLTIAERLGLVSEAGFDGIDFDEAGDFTPEQVKQASIDSGVFVHNAINHAHWQVRLSSPDAQTRAQAVANLEHCVRCSHAAGGSGVLIVVGKGEDGPENVLNDRIRSEIEKVIPLAASLGQHILFENVWNQLHYDHNSPPEQLPTRFVEFVDSFKTPWVGMYYDVGNHWKYGQPSQWFHAFGNRAVKLDLKGFSRKLDKFVDLTSAEDDVPWDEVRQAMKDVGFRGWVTAEVSGGGLERLTVIRKQVEKAIGIV
jgi:L-ribulose-5-phosphate 3-epimerase